MFCAQRFWMKIALIQRELEFTRSLFIQIQSSCVSLQEDMSCPCDLKVSCK